MIPRKMISGACLVLVLSVFAGPAMAAKRFYNVNVTLVGLSGGGGNALIQLSDTKSSPDFTKKWFTITSTNRNEMLALAMAAMTSGLTLKVKTDISLNGKPSILVMYLNGN